MCPPGLQDSFLFVQHSQQHSADLPCVFPLSSWEGDKVQDCPLTHGDSLEPGVPGMEWGADKFLLGEEDRGLNYTPLPRRVHNTVLERALED